MNALCERAEMFEDRIYDRTKQVIEYTVRAKCDVAARSFTSSHAAWDEFEQTTPVSGHSKPAREGQMKTSHFESEIAHRAVKAAMVRDVPTPREPATFHYHTGRQRLVGAQNRP
jgi:hypothetical protein